jgi:hypothetical protein
MQNQASKGRFKRFASRPKPSEAPPPSTPPTSSQTNQADNDYNDRQQVEKRYKKAADQLRNAIKIRKGSWAPFDLELSSEPEGLDESQFKNAINAALLSRETSIKDKKGWSKLMNAVESVFTALSPITKNLLSASQGAQSVIPFLPV